ncbi:uncharacterized protein [Nicotiana sylvestris]|uniref:uncharacterized protein n=1 Tax=Nicotiana sylvestris TaxID=4096 RepID=UPI00388C7F4E
MDLTRDEETLEEGSGAVHELQVRHGTVHIDEIFAGNFGGPEPEVSRGREEILTEIDALGGFKSGPSFSSGEIRDAQDTGTAGLVDSHGEENNIGDYFIGIDMDTDLEAPVALEEAEKLQQQAKKLYDRALSNLQDALSCREKELEKLTSNLNKSKASSARQEEELGELRASIEGVHEERTSFAEQTFDKLKSELLCYQARLRKAVDGEKSFRLICDKRWKKLRHLWYEANRSLNYESHLEKQNKTEDLERLCGEVGQAKYECNDLRAQIDAHIATKKNTLAKASTLEIQLQNARENNSVQTSRIARLESDLSEMKAEVMEAGAKVEEIQAKVDRKVAIYLKDVADARAELRGASDWESRSSEYARCTSRRETLKEIHAKGFDFLEEIEKAKVDEYDAMFPLFDAEDNEREVDGATVPEEKVE